MSGGGDGAGDRRLFCFTVRLLRPERLDEIFEAHRSRQYEREIVCSELVALMMGVATRTHQSVPAAQKTLGVSAAAAVYGKLACFEPRVTALVATRRSIWPR